MKKIVVFANAFWMKNRGLGGGGDKRFIELAKRGLTEKFKVTMIVSKMTERNYKHFLEGTESKITFVQLPFSFLDKLGLVPSYFFRTLLAMVYVPKFKKNPIFYSTSDFLPDVLPAFAGKLLNKNAKWVQIIHHIYPDWRFRLSSKLKNFIAFYAQKISFFFIKRYADSIIVVNPIVKKNLENMGFYEDKIEVNPNGISLEYLSNVKLVDSGDYAGVFLGRLHPSKGIFDLVEIWKYVCKKNPGAKLAIIGGGDQQIGEELKERAKNANLQDNIDILGYLEDDRAYGTLKSSKIFVFPSYEEGFGIAILEAMACGLPVVAWDLPVYDEIYGESILKVPMGNIYQFSEAILQLIKDKNLRDNFISKGRKIAEKYDWDITAKKELSLINSV